MLIAGLRLPVTSQDSLGSLGWDGEKENETLAVQIGEGVEEMKSDAIDGNGMGLFITGKNQTFKLWMRIAERAAGYWFCMIYYTDIRSKKKKKICIHIRIWLIFLSKCPNSYPDLIGFRKPYLNLPNWDVDMNTVG